MPLNFSPDQLPVSDDVSVHINKARFKIKACFMSLTNSITVLANHQNSHNSHLNPVSVLLGEVYDLIFYLYLSSDILLNIYHS